MPLFDFECHGCGRHFERLVRGAEVPLCPHCGSSELARHIGATSPPNRSQAIIQSARAQANREGHFSHYVAKERPKPRR